MKMRIARRYLFSIKAKFRSFLGERIKMIALSYLWKLKMTRIC